MKNRIRLYTSGREADPIAAKQDEIIVTPTVIWFVEKCLRELADTVFRKKQ